MSSYLRRKKKYLKEQRHQKPERCSAVQYSDQMNCNRCGYVWDMNDPDPPECKTPYEVGLMHIERMKKKLLDGEPHVR